MKKPRPSSIDWRRRELLQGLAGLAAAGLPRPSRAARPAARVGVVGGGIVGASIAMHLAEGGASVVLFEKTAPAAGATKNSFAWVNAFVDDHAYRSLRLASMAAYHRLDALLGLRVLWGGYLNWASDAAESKVVAANALQLRDTAYPVRMLSAAELGAAQTALVAGPVSSALWSSIDGHLDPVYVTGRFLARAAAFGARIVKPCELEQLQWRRGRVTGALTSRGQFEFDQIVIAAGVDTPRLLNQAGFALTLRHAPGMLAHSRGVATALRPVCDAPGGLSFKQMANGSIVGTDAPEPPDLPVHAEIRQTAIDFPDESIRTMHGHRVLDKIAEFFPASQQAELDFVTLGFRPMPTDGFPIIGPVPGTRGLYIAVTHSGVTLAPLLGELVATELLDGQPVTELARYRPERFSA